MNDKTNRGAIWGNARKEQESHPDFTGSMNIDGKEYWVNAWKRKPDAGPKAPALSFSVRPKDAQQSGQQSYADVKGKNRKPNDDMDGDRIPF